MRRAYFLIGVNKFISLAEVIYTGLCYLDTSSTQVKMLGKVLIQEIPVPG